MYQNSKEELLEYLRNAMHASLREAEMLRNFKIPKLENQSPQIGIVSHEIQPRPQFLILLSDESLLNTIEWTTKTPESLLNTIESTSKTPEKDILGSISPESETLLATKILTSLTEESIPPTPTTPGIRDEYEDISEPEPENHNTTQTEPIIYQNTTQTTMIHNTEANNEPEQLIYNVTQIPAYHAPIENQ